METEAGAEVTGLTTASRRCLTIALRFLSDPCWNAPGADGGTLNPHEVTLNRS